MLNTKRLDAEQEFEKHEAKVRETTEKLRKEKSALEGELQPMVNQFNKVK